MLFKATKEIPSGQELFIRYNDLEWFKSKNITYADINYASTMWWPDLQPLPCRQNVAPTTGAGQHSFSVAEAIPSGTVLEISLCVEVSVFVVDQFPYLWDFVLTGETENERTGCQQTSTCSRSHRFCVCRRRRRKYRRTCRTGSRFSLVPPTLSARSLTLVVHLSAHSLPMLKLVIV